MKIIITRASDNTRRVEYEPEEVKKVDLKDIINRYGRCEFGEVINILDAEADKENPEEAILYTIGYNATSGNYYQNIGYGERRKIEL